MYTDLLLLLFLLLLTFINRLTSLNQHIIGNVAVITYQKNKRKQPENVTHVDDLTLSLISFSTHPFLLTQVQL